MTSRLVMPLLVWHSRKWKWNITTCSRWLCSTIVMVELHFFYQLQSLQRKWFHIILVGGLEHVLFSHKLGIVIPIDFHIFQRGRSTTNQYSISFQLRRPSAKNFSFLALWHTQSDILKNGRTRTSTSVKDVTWRQSASGWKTNDLPLRFSYELDIHHTSGMRFENGTGRLTYNSLGHFLRKKYV